MNKLLLLFIAMPCLASGPKYVGSQTDPAVLQEFQNVYHDIANPSSNVGSISTFTVKNSISVPSLGSDTLFSPSVSSGFGTITQSSCWYWRIGSHLHVRCTFRSGTIAASLASIAVPASLAIDYAKISTNGDMVGWWANSHTEIVSVNGDEGPVFVDGSDTGTFYFGQSGTTGTLFSKSNVNSVIHSSNDYFFFNAEIPIVGWSY